MKIRYISSDVESETNAVLTTVAERAAAEGIRLAGTVQPPTAEMLHQRCRIILRLLPDGPVRDVSMDLGPGATGCRLDTGALEEAVQIVHARLAGAEGLVVNKFGKQEAAGRGLVAAIGIACEAGLPVLVGVSPDWRAAFLDFAGDVAQPMAANADEVLDWLRICRPA